MYLLGMLYYISEFFAEIIYLII